MTTSITDARYTSLHFTPGALLALSIDEPPETGWSVMPGYDEHIPIPPEQEPPRMDADETLPNLLHPSYPYGRPPTLNGKGGQQGKGWTRGGKSLLSTVGDGIDLRGGNGSAAGRGWMGSRWAGEEGWAELALGGFVEKTAKKEVPPGMAGAKRPPSPPSPALRPSQAPQPRSEHLRNLYARQQQANPTPTADQFDAPVPNELYAEEGEAAGNDSALTNTVVPEAMEDQQGSFRSDENNHDDEDDGRSVD